ncbi:MAG TPA: hypothetical protein VFG73_02415 [Rhodanobacteraceae bacterium]|nr:hypothetical protein [Rhodanobacteraceae bacterium]
MGTLLWAVALFALLGTVGGLASRAWDSATARAAEALFRQRAEAARQALLWYSDRGHWRRVTIRGRHWSRSPAADDAGARARRALEQTS